MRLDTQKAFSPYLISALYPSRPLRLIIEREVEAASRDNKSGHI